MQDDHLEEQQLAELRAAHRSARKAPAAYRLNAAILLGSGWSPSEVARALLIDDDSVRSHFKRYKQGGIAALERMNDDGSGTPLSAAHLAELDAQLKQHLHPNAAFLVRWVKAQKSNTGRQRLNIDGVIDAETMRAVIRYPETFADDKAACDQFLADLDAHAEQSRSLLTEDFEIIRNY